MTVEISQLSQAELHEAKKLIKKVFMAFEAPDYSDEGIAHFMLYLTEALENEVATGQVRIWCGKKDHKIIGVLAVRLPAHIALLFVDETHQQQGIAKKLYQTMLLAVTPDYLTVNSSPYAIPIYKRLGFRCVGQEEIVSGIRFQSMVLTREDG